MTSGQGYNIDKLPEDEKVKFIPGEELIFEVKSKCKQARIELTYFVYETGARINETISLFGTGIA